ncbi:hypothetical protein EB118_21460 [bacterium]|nr:hypothetical protein [bacterium]NDD83650.1 hypothetical protein [bacterium]NDG32627.1 hypothetical protein [bacterium]
MVLVGIYGKAGSGKDYLAEKYIIPFFRELNQTCLKWSFADQLKVNVMTKYDIPFSDLYTQKTEGTRRLLQIEGTEKGRHIHGEDIWIKYFNNWVKVLTGKGIDNIIVSDVRFRNELHYITSNNGIIIKVVAPMRHKLRIMQECNGEVNSHDILSTHVSECDMDNVPDSDFDIVIKNDINDPIISHFNFSQHLAKLVLQRTQGAPGL